MNWFIMSLSGETAQHLAMTLIHTLWQGCVIAIALWTILRITSPQKVYRRYTISLLSLGMLVLCGFFTFSILRYNPPLPQESGMSQSVSAAAAEQSPAVSSMPAVLTPAANLIPHTAIPPRINWTFYGLCVWGCGVLCMILRLGMMLADQSNLRRHCLPITDSGILTVFEELKNLLHVPDRIQLVICSKISVPAVMGFIRPVLLLPASAITGIEPDMLKAILAHELAHIRRYDYLINLCQMVIESLLFFNPAVWWVSRQIRLEREACCDAAGSAAIGRQTDYARLLLNWIVQTVNAPSSPQAAMAFSEDRHQTLERARRMLTPGYRPQMHFSWLKLSVVLILTCVGILALSKTTDITVAFAGQLLSPKERIEKMAELEKSYGQPAYDPNWSSQLTEDQKSTIAGTIKTWDGKPVTKYTQLLYHTQRPRSSSSISDRLISDCNNLDGVEIYYNKFRRKLDYGTITIAASMDGYAPGFYGPFKLQPGQSKEDIEIILGQGYRADILVQDENNIPIPDAKITGGYLYYSGGYQHTINLTTNEQGLTAIEHAGDVNVSLNLTADGFEDTKYENIALQKEAPLILKMNKAEPAEGIVISAETNQPIANAQIRLLRYIPNGSSYGKDYGPILGTSDSSGKFILNRLRKDASYILVVKVDGFAYKILYDIKAGQKDIVASLPKDLVIHGKVLGPLEKLSTQKGQLVMPYNGRFSYAHNDEGSSTEYAPITITEQGAFFEIRNPWGNKVEICPPKHNGIAIDLENTIPEPVVVDLSEKLTKDGKPYHKRTVILTFDTPKEMPAPTGTIRLNYKDPMYSRATYNGLLLEIKDGQAQAWVDAPGEIQYSLANTVGYWFAEKTIPVDDGTEPMQVKIPVVPAGMIYGQVFEEDGSPAGNTMVSFSVIKKSAFPENTSGNFRVEGKNSSSSAETETQYTVNPLPLGGTYCVIAHRNSTYQVSEPIKLTDKNPIQQVDLFFPKGVTLKGQVFTPDGKPASQVSYSLSFSIKSGHGFGTGDKTADRNGCFEIPGINTQIDGTYTLKIKPQQDYRPVRMMITDFSEPIRITLEKGAILTGKLIDKETGWPIQGAKIRAFYHSSGDSEHLYSESVADSSGHFRFSNMKAGAEYSLHPEECRCDTAFKAVGGQAKETVIIATPYEWGQAKVVKPRE